MTDSDEIRYLPAEELKAEEVVLLDWLVSFCQEKDLRLSLAYGTLLGAIRHHGFIPWDDDIDVLMPRPDYEILIACASEIQMHKPFQLVPYHKCTLENSPFIKLVNSNIPVHLEREQNQSFLWIDIFPVDGLSNDYDESKRIIQRGRQLQTLVTIAGKMVKQGRDPLHTFMRKIGGAVLSVDPHATERFARRLTNLSKRIPYGSTEWVADIAWGPYGIGERIPLEGFEQQITAEFEGKAYPCMSCWEEYLTGIYGDWRQLPPENQRVAHYLNAWRVGGDRG